METRCHLLGLVSLHNKRCCFHNPNDHRIQSTVIVEVTFLPNIFKKKERSMIAGTLQTDPRSGGIKRSSDVNVLPIVAETWSKVRDNANKDVDWLICGYVPNSKTDITVVVSGSGGPNAAASALPQGEPSWGGCKMSTGRFMGFYYVPDDVPAMKKGRASMHKNGVLNVLEGRDGEIAMQPGYTE